MNPQPPVLETGALPIELVPFGSSGHAKALPEDTKRRVYGAEPAKVEPASRLPGPLWNDRRVSASTQPLSEQSPDELAAFLAAQQAAYDALAAQGLGGVEVDHLNHSDEARTELRGLARDLDLVVTGSSDYHGAGKGPEFHLGAHTTAPEELERLLGR